MSGVIAQVKKYGVSQYDDRSVDIDDKSSLIQDFTHHSPIVSAIADNDSAEVGVSYLSCKTLQDLCFGYGYSIDFETIAKVCDCNFFQEYASSCGYQFTESFLSSIYKHRVKLVRKINPILTEGFSFLKNGSSKLKITDELMDGISYSFSKAVYDLRPKCIDILQIHIVPLVIKSITNSGIIDNNCERKMTYQEMERFFLYYITTLERLIMAKIMNYWEDFCDANKYKLSSLSVVDYINPFTRSYKSAGIIVPQVNYPAAFVCIFESCISFMAIDKIEDMMDDFVVKFVDELKNIVRCKCAYICSHGDNACESIKKMRNGLTDLIKKEFYKRVREKEVTDYFNNFLSKLIIWHPQNLGDENVKNSKSLIFEAIIVDIYKSLTHSLDYDLQNIVKYFHYKLTKSMKCMSKVGNLHITLENKFMVRLHPEDSNSIYSLMNDFHGKYIDVIRDKFCMMLKEKYEFPDGTAISTVSWDKISKNIFPIVKEAVSNIVKEERLCIYKILSNARIVDDAYSSFANIRNATSEEKDSIFKFIIYKIDQKITELFKKVWVDYRKDSVGCTSGNNESSVVSVDDVIPMSLPKFRSDILVSAGYEQGESPLVTSFPIDLDFFSSTVRGDKIVNMWGLNLHPEDDKLILILRKKFSSKIKEHVRNLFSDMLKTKFSLPSGKVIHKCSWSLVSNDLYTLAMESIESILEEQYVELDEILSKARIVDVTANDISSCIVRDVTDDEKNILMIRSRKLIYGRLSHSFRLSWLDITEYSKSAGYGYKEISENADDGVIEGSWGVRLRYSDNIAILRARRRFSSDIVVCISSKFHEMIKNKYKFGDGTVIARVAWFRVSRKLFPIAKEEIRYILEDESKELEQIISRSRVLVNPGVYRDITDEEKQIVLENIMKLVCKKLKPLFSRSWSNVITSLCRSHSDLEDGVEDEATTNYGGELSLPSSDFMSIRKERDAEVAEDVWGVIVRYEDDIAILNVRRKFSSEISKSVRRKFIEIIKNGYKLEDGTTIGDLPWKTVSRKLMPVAENEIAPIVEIECAKINEILLKSRVVISESDFTRELTSDERSSIMKTIVKSIHKQFVAMSSIIWGDVIRLSVDSKNSETTGENKGKIGSKKIGGVKIRYDDSAVIFSIKREYNHKIVPVLRSKFSKMIKNRYKFEDDSILGKFAWFRVSKKMFPIAKEEVKNIIEDESNRLWEFLSEARVCVDDTTDRSLTTEERGGVFKSITRLIDKGLKSLCAKVWSDVISCLGRTYIDHDVCITSESSLSSDDLIKFMKVDAGFVINNSRVMFCYEDDISILNVKKRFSSEISRCVRCKFVEMLEIKYRFDDGTIIGKLPWKVVSKKVLPIVTKEIIPIIEKERIEISNILSKSRVIVYSSNDDSSITRILTSKEIHGILNIIMESVYRSEIYRFSKIWVRLIKSLKEESLRNDMNLYRCGNESKKVESDNNCSSPLCLLDLREEDIEELDNIRLEFIGSLGAIIGNFVNSSPSKDVGISSSYSLDDVISYVSKRSSGLFKEGGFLHRVKLILSVARVVSLPGKDRLLTAKERKFISQLFMDSIDSDRDYLIRKRVGGLSSRPSVAKVAYKDHDKCMSRMITLCTYPGNYSSSNKNSYNYNA
ncbi:hypothetical protein [Candidatus Ichthyocystis hellenicum]|nr:hypothetical protein [Candidatus Ichthyocystis hellenicum]